MASQLSVFNSDENIFSLKNSLIGIDGIEGNASTLCCTDFIDVANYRYLYYNLKLGTNTPVCLYDEDKEFIANIYLTTQSAAEDIFTGLVDLSEYGNVKYLRCSCKTDYLKHARIKLFTESDYDIILNNKDKQLCELFKNSTVIDIPLQIFGYYAPELNWQMHDSNKTLNSGFVDIEKIDAITFTARMASALSSIQAPVLTLWDENKNFLKVIVDYGVYYDEQLVLEEYKKLGGRYIIFQTNTELSNNPFHDYYIKAYSNIRNSISNDFEIIEKDVDFNVGGYYSERDKQWKDSAMTKCSGYLDISLALSITFTSRIVVENSKGVVITLWDENENYVKALVPAGEYHDFTFDLTPYKAEGRYIRISSNSELSGGPGPFSGYYAKLRTASSPADNIASVKYVAEYVNNQKFAKIQLNYLSAKDYAKADGTTDDTEALENLFKDAEILKKAIYFPEGTYLIRRSLPLKSNMEIFGDGRKSIIKRRASVWTKVVQNIKANDEEVFVESTSGLNIGDQFYITNSPDISDAAARHCTVGVITGIEGNKVTFKSSYDSIKKGAIRNQNAGCFLSTGFGILRSWGMLYDADYVYIHDLALDGNRADGEPMEWFNGNIHFDAGKASTVEGIPYSCSSTNHTIKNCYIYNSPFDGISDQGQNELYVENCVISNSAMHGIHLGTKFERAKIIGCSLHGNEEIGAGIFWCQDVSRLIIEDNYISDFNHGCSDEEYGTGARDSIINNNIFENIISSVFNFRLSTASYIGGCLIISGNIVLKLNKELFNGKYLNGVNITNNVIKTIQGSDITLIKIINSSNICIAGNIICDTVNIENNVIKTDTVNIIESNNIWKAE